MGSERIKGTGLLLQLGGIDHWADAVEVVLDCNRDDEFSLDGHLAPQGYRWWFDVIAVQSTDPASLWTVAWDHAYETVPFTYAPHGNADPTPARPHFTGTLQFGHPPSLGGAAGVASEYTFTTRLYIPSGKPQRVTS